MKVTLTTNGLVWSPDQEPLFMHCANGSESVTQEVFWNEVLPVLTAHNVEVDTSDLLEKHSHESL